MKENSRSDNMHAHPHGHGAEKSRAALISIFASTGLVVTKFAVALITGSLALLVEALHSLMDLGATVITYFAVRWSDRPADGSHHYGHGKIESLAALFEVALLFALAIYATVEGVSRLISDAPSDVTASPLAIGILLISIVIDFFRARALQATASKTSSQALEADSLHFVSDMWASIAALAGLIGIASGFAKADAVAALAVAVIIVWISYELFIRTIKTLLDEAPAGSADLIERIAAETSGVVRVSRVRLREVGATTFCEISVDVPRNLPLPRVEQIKQNIRSATAKAFPKADLSILTEPVALQDESIAEKVMMIAARQHVFIHHLTVQQKGDQIAIGLDLEIDENMQLAKAHDIATRLETAIVDDFGPETEVETHLEPLESFFEITPASIEAAAAMERSVQKLAAEFPPLTNIHDLRLRESRAGKIVILHCHVPGALSVRDVHFAVDGLERKLREQHPDLVRVVIHAEPGDVPHLHS